MELSVRHGSYRAAWSGKRGKPLLIVHIEQRVRLFPPRAIRMAAPDQLTEVLAALAENGRPERAGELASGLSADRKKRASVVIAKAAARVGKVEFAA